MKRILLLFIVLLMVGVDAVWAQTRRVTGTVLDEKSQGLPGAGVLIKGTQSGTATDADGKFQLDVPDENNTLVVQAIGYTRREVTITGSSMVIRMQPETKALNETVVTALGIRREARSLGYTQSTVDSAAIERSGEQNIIEALAGKSAGILVTGSGGTPGASSQILLRGNGNIGGGVSEPLFVVDGIPIDNGTSQPVAGDYPYDQNLTGVNESNRGVDINPNDIESVTILRGPAAAALYGVRGGNGAIVITTKRGKFGKGRKKLGVDFSSSTEISQVNKMPDVQQVYLQGAGGLFSNASNLSWGPRADTSGIPTYDRFKDFFRTGTSYINNLGLTFGGENSSFRVGLGNTKIDGIIPNSQFKRTTANFNAQAKLSDFLTVGGDFNYTNSEGLRVQNGSNIGGAMLTLMRAPINYNIKDYVDAAGNETQYFAGYDNPLFTVNRNPYTDKTNRVFGNVNATINFTRDLSLTDRLGVDAYSTTTKQIFDLSSLADDNADGMGQINLSTTNSVQVYNDLILKYNTHLSQDFTLDALAGYNYTYNSYLYDFSRGRNIQIPGIYTLNNTNSLYASNIEDYERTQAVFAEATVGYKSMLYLTATGRNDWLSYFGRNGNSFFYPKGDISWIFSELIPKSDAFSYGKVRLAFADAGSGPRFGNYLFPNTPFVQPFITDGNTNGVGFPYNGQVGYGPSNILIDPNIRAQHVQGTEAGAELHFWKNRITFEGTVYNQLTLDNIIDLPIAPSTGYAAYRTNGGTSRNRGIELALSADVIKTRNFKWNIFGNWTMDRSKVLSLNPQISEVPVGNGFSEIGSYAIVGQPLGVFYGTAWERDPATGKVLVDENGQAIVAQNSKVIGNPNPDWTMGIGSTFSYKGLSFSFLWDIRKGGDIWDGTYARLNRLGVTGESADREHSYLIDGIYAPGTPNAGQQNTTTVPATYYYQTFKGDGGNYAAENAIEDGSWVRLRSVNLSYRFIFNTTTRHCFVDYLEIGVTGKNLWLITKYKGVDPETSLTGASSAFRGYDYFNNPGTKSFIFNIKLGL